MNFKFKTDNNICYYTCKYFTVKEDGMYCNHPIFSNKPFYTGYIISQHNCKNGKIPEECPLQTIENVIKENKL